MSRALRALAFLFVCFLSPWAVAEKVTVQLRVSAPSAISIDQIRVRLIRDETEEAERINELRETIHELSREEIKELLKTVKAPTPNSKSNQWIDGGYTESNGWRSFVFEEVSVGPQRIEVLVLGYQRGGFFPFFGGWRRLKGTSSAELLLSEPVQKEIFYHTRIDRLNESSDNLKLSIDKIKALP